MYRSLNLLSFQVIQIMLIGLMNGYFSFVNVVLWEMGPFTGNMNLLVTAVVMEPLAIMKCVYIREKPQGQHDNPQKALDRVHYILIRRRINNRRNTLSHACIHRHEHTIGWRAINYWPPSCLDTKKRHI